MDFQTLRNWFLGSPPTPPLPETIPENSPTPTTLLCPQCTLLVPWDDLDLTPSRKTFSCPHCHSFFCLICKAPTANTNHPPHCRPQCPLDPEHPGALLTLLLFHETLYELQGRLFEINRDFGALKVGFEGLDPPALALAPGLMVRVYECVERSEEDIEAARRIAGELYGMMVGMGEGGVEVVGRGGL